jgi:hypothetical protein
MTNRIHGVPFRTLPTGERVPDCCRARRYINHVFSRWLFHRVPQHWLDATGWRNKVWDWSTENFGWWGYTHRDGYSGWQSYCDPQSLRDTPPFEIGNPR